MNFITVVLEAFLREQVKARLSAGGRVQPVLIASSQELLASLWGEMTDEGARNWMIDHDDTADVVVVLIEEEPPADAGTGVLSARGTWDYAVSLRNSGAPCLILASARAWNASQESIVQASEQLWLEAPPSRRAPTEAFWNAWESAASQKAGTGTGEPALPRMLLLAAAGASLPGLPGRDEDRVWAIADEMLAASDREALIARTGLPRFDPGTNVRDVAREVGRMATAARTDGLGSVRDAMLTAAAAMSSQLVDEVGKLFEQVEERAGTGAAFEADWHAALKHDGTETWWKAIDYEVLKKLLIGAGITKPSGKVTLAPRGVLNQERDKGEPCIVRGAPTFDVGKPASAHDTPAVHRVAQGKKGVGLVQAADGSFVDTGAPSEAKPLRYRASCGQLQSAIVSVIDIESYPLGVIVSAAGKAEVESPSEEGGQWIQRVGVPKPGMLILDVYLPSNATMVKVDGWARDGEEITPVSGVVRIGPRRVEGGERVAIEVELPDRSATLSVLIDIESEHRETCPGMLEALLALHGGKQGTLSSVQAPSSPLRLLEARYLEDGEHWRGCYGGWRLEQPHEWGWLDGEFCFGDLPIRSNQVETLKRAAAPPPEVLEAREAIRERLRLEGLQLPEVLLANDEYRGLAMSYIGAWVDWFGASPRDAAWFDVIALFAPEESEVGKQLEPSAHPVAVLLSPLHPLRVAWLCAAHSLLHGGKDFPCPLAGELSAFAAPSSMALPLGVDPHRQEPEWRGFQRAPTDQPWWQLMWSVDPSTHAARSVVARQLQALGMHARVAVPGMDSAQAIRAIDDVSFLTPSRTSLRIGLAGASKPGAAADAVLDWIEERFLSRTEDRTAVPLNPREIDVLDLRVDPEGPDMQRVADLAELSSGALRWYGWSGHGEIASDLLLVEGLGEESTRALASETRSAASGGVLFRIDQTREGPNQTLIEPRRMDSLPTGADGSLESHVEAACVAIEGTAGGLAGADHVERRPPGILHLLRQAKYVALGSGEIDPSLLATTAHEGGALIWDYELPVPGEPLGSRVGYYLLASATSAQKRRVDDALALIVGKNKMNADDVLREVSARGIPLLRRFAAGGSTSRGELGLFLAVRLLQGSPSAGGATIPAFNNGAVNLLVSVDSYDHYLGLIRRSLKDQAQRVMDKIPDLLLVTYTPGSAPSIKLTPIEVKYRGTSIETAEMLKSHIDQAASLGSLLDTMFTTLSGGYPLWARASRAWLGAVLNHAFRIYSAPGLSGTTVANWSGAHGTCLRELLAGTAAIEVVREGKLLVFDLSESAAVDANDDGVLDTIRIGFQDSKGIVLSGNVRAPLRAMVHDVFGYQPSSYPAGTGDNAGGDAGGAVSVTISAPAPDGSAGGDELAPSPPGTGDPTPFDEARSRVAREFRGFIGNANAIDRVSRDLVIALTSEPRALSKSLLFSGPPSSGKTELCRRVAGTLGLPFVPLDGTALKSRDKLFELVDAALKQAGVAPTAGEAIGGLPVAEYPPFTVFVDEVHLVPRPVQESFLTALESKDRTVHLGNRYARLANATFLFATTRPASVDSALRSRCETINLLPYTVDEVAIMLANAFPGWLPEVHERLAILGRRVPRVALRLANDLRNEALIQGANPASEGMLIHLETIRKERQIEDDGIGVPEIDYLRILQRAGGKPVGLDRVSAQMRAIPVETIETEIEPFLLEERLIELTGRGRQLTRKGMERLAKIPVST